MPYITNKSDIVLYDKPIYKNIINHIVKYDIITVKQCANIFYSGHVYGLQESQRTLNKLVKSGLIKVLKPKRKQYVYYIDKPTARPHTILLMDLYSLFIKNGFDIEYFAKEVKFGIKNPDSVVEYSSPTLDNIVPLLIEIDVTHYTRIKTLEKLYDSGIVHNYYLKRYGISLFPTVVIITDKIKKEYSNKFNIVYLDYSLNEFNQYFKHG